MTKKGRRLLGLVGANGRLGRLVSAELESRHANEWLWEAIDTRQPASEWQKRLLQVDLILDVSNPSVSVEILKALRRLKITVPLVIGCTGWTLSQMRVVRGYSKLACVVLCPNFSMGVAVFLNAIARTAAALEPFGYRVQISETHHRHKKDAPSGTAKAMLDQLPAGMRPPLDSVKCLRLGEVVGRHEITFFGQYDRLTLIHEAQDRVVFAQGAVRVADWAWKNRKQRAQLYSIQDILWS